jgi:hypothetical protein
MERAGLKPGLYNGEARNAGKDALRKDSGQAGATNLGLKQKRPDRVGAQVSTRILYHSGNAGQIKNEGPKKENQKPPR